MTPIMVLVCIVVICISGALGIFILYAPEREDSLRVLTGGDGSGVAGFRTRLANDATGAEIDRVKKFTKRQIRRNPKVTLEEKFFHAGMHLERQKHSFYRLRLICPILTVSAAIALAYQIDTPFGYYALIGFGIILGIQLPISILDRKIIKQSDEIMYYLPVVVEQIVIGVSSSLDIGPCVQGIIKMADERDNHNAVTELLRHCQHMVRSGVSFEEALHEVGRLSGHTELKHTFMALAQVVRHGGEVIKQLQELANAVTDQRETKIEAKIKKLELEATGPVGLVFVAFLSILLIGIGTQFMKAFP